VDDRVQTLDPLEIDHTGGRVPAGRVLGKLLVAAADQAENFVTTGAQKRPPIPKPAMELQIPSSGAMAIGENPLQILLDD
jgi:hypothetical protein